MPVSTAPFTARFINGQKSVARLRKLIEEREQFLKYETLWPVRGNPDQIKTYVTRAMYAIEESSHELPPRETPFGSFLGKELPRWIRLLKLLDNYAETLSVTPAKRREETIDMEYTRIAVAASEIQDFLNIEKAYLNQFNEQKSAA